jgi:hypothetical protein
MHLQSFTSVFSDAATGTMLRNMLQFVPELSAFANIDLKIAFNMVTISLVVLFCPFPQFIECLRHYLFSYQGSLEGTAMHLKTSGWLVECGLIVWVLLCWCSHHPVEQRLKAGSPCGRRCRTMTHDVSL